jgi:D-amino-acid dehydrogenase
VTDARRALVVGAGIVGICTGLELQRRGWTVTLVDRLEPGTGCSFGNAGILAAMAVVPVGMPGFGRQLPRMLLDPDSPLVVRWRALPQTLPWLLHFRRAAKARRIPQISDAMHALYRSTVELHAALAGEAEVPELVRPNPGLYVHRDPGAIDVAGGLAWKLRRERGAEIDILEGAALRDAEPELSSAYTRGVRVGPMGFTTNPLRLAQSYCDLFSRRGGKLLRGAVLRLRPSGPVVTIETSDGTLVADTVVIAAGAWTRSLVEPLGLALPLIAERGYHMTFADPGITLRHVVTELESHFAVTPMEMGLRIAGTEELGHADDPPAWRRADVLQKQARRMFPPRAARQWLALDGAPARYARQPSGDRAAAWAAEYPGRGGSWPSWSDGCTPYRTHRGGIGLRRVARHCHGVLCAGSIRWPPMDDGRKHDQPDQHQGIAMIDLQTFANLAAQPLGAFAPKPTSLTEGQCEASAKLWTSPDGRTAIGVWECTPGRFTADRSKAAEYCHIISGSATVSNQDGSVVRRIGPGDLLVLPLGWTGEWEIHAQMRKLYFLSSAAPQA